MNRVLIAGFGPFNGVIDNPSAAIAEALDGCIYNGVAVVGREMPVSHRRSIELCAMARASVDPVAILGIGVALSRTAVTVEDWASRPSDVGKEDIDGHAVPVLDGTEPERRQSTIDGAKLAQLLDADLGDDAGDYVCNSWLFQAVGAFDIPVGFIHIPPTGLDPAKLLVAVGQIWGCDDGR